MSDAEPELPFTTAIAAKPEKLIRPTRQSNNRSSSAVSLADAWQVPRYSSAVWLCSTDSLSGVVRTTIGWAMSPEGGSKFFSGGWTLRTRLENEEQIALSVLSPVEETYGAVFHKPTDLEERLNEHVERLVSDWLLFLTHRVLFGQCSRLESRMPNFTTDILLLLGPTLPKFVGRICYSNLTRDKTIAVLAPEIATENGPNQNSMSWSPHPVPRYYHDCARRRWIANGTDEVSSPQRISSFDIIEPIGDGLSGEILLPGGPELWAGKADLIQQILDTDRVDSRFAIWKNQPVFVPTGIQHAMRAALLQQDLDSSQQTLTTLLQGLAANTKRTAVEYRRNVARGARGLYDDETFQRLVVSYAAREYIAKISVAKADRTTVATRISDKQLQSIADQIVEKLGDSARPLS